MPTKAEKEHQQLIKAHLQKIGQVYNKSVDRIAVQAMKQVYLPGSGFVEVDKYPAFKKLIEKELTKLHAEVYATTVNGIKDAWKLSNKHNDLMVANRVGEGAPDWLFDPNKEAMNSFITRKTKGMDLSGRVWKGLGPHRPFLEEELGMGIMQGKSAKELAKEMKQHLNEPDKLFRRVRNDKGQLVLSKAARAYKPGRGVYRSSYKNALRLTATETNMAYRSADNERWKTLPFVTGYRVRLSESHPRRDICDDLAGDYPKTFVWRGWHPWCLCNAIPIMISDAQYAKMEEDILNGKEPETPPDTEVKGAPPGFLKYVKKNNKKLKEQKPYWYRDNPEFVKITPAARKKAGAGIGAYDQALYRKHRDIQDMVKQHDQIPPPTWAKKYPELSVDERVAIRAYTGSFYDNANKYLRSGRPSDSWWMDNNYAPTYSTVLDNALKKVSKKYQGTCHRGTDLPDDVIKRYQAAYKTGKPFEEAGFLSTSYEASSAFSGSVKYVIRGKNGVNVKPLSKFDRENEVIYTKGTQFKIIQMEQSGGRTYIEMEEL